MNLISKICDYVYVLDSGVNIARGTPEQILNDSKVLEVYLGGRKSKWIPEEGVPKS